MPREWELNALVVDLASSTGCKDVLTKNTPSTSVYLLSQWRYMTGKLYKLTRNARLLTALCCRPLAPLPLQITHLDLPTVWQGWSYES